MYLNIPELHETSFNQLIIETHDLIPKQFGFNARHKKLSDNNDKNRIEYLYFRFTPIYKHKHELQLFLNFW